MKELFSKTPVWLLAIAFVVFVAFFLERTYIEKVPFKFFGMEFGPTDARPNATPSNELLQENESLTAMVQSLRAKLTEEKNRTKSVIDSKNAEIDRLSASVTKLQAQIKDLNKPASNRQTKNFNFDGNILKNVAIEVIYGSGRELEAIKAKQKLIEWGASVTLTAHKVEIVGERNTATILNSGAKAAEASVAVQEILAEGNPSYRLRGDLTIDSQRDWLDLPAILNRYQVLVIFW